MDKSIERHSTELQALVAIQKEMLEESKRLSELTGWLIGLALLLVGASVITIFAM